MGTAYIFLILSTQFVLKIKDNFCNSECKRAEQTCISRGTTKGIQLACADPESFVRGGPTLTFFVLFFSLMRGRRIKIPLLAGHYQPKRRFASLPMMALH